MNVSARDLPEQQEYDGAVFPYALSPEGGEGTYEEMLTWLTESRAEMRARLQTHGAILFRGFPVRTDQQFDGFVGALDCPNFPYRESLSNAVRVNRTERVFTANEAPPDVTIYLHHEMAQTPVYPSSLFFFCEQAAEEGGATPLCRSDVFWRCCENGCPRLSRRVRRMGFDIPT